MIPVKIREGKLATFRKGNENWSLKWAVSILVLPITYYISLLRHDVGWLFSVDPAPSSKFNES